MYEQVIMQFGPALINALIGGLVAPIAAIVALAVTYITLHFEQKTRYDKVGEQILIWKLEAYRELARAMSDGITAAAKRANRPNLDSALRDYGRARKDLVLLISNESLKKSITQFHELLREAETLLNDNDSLTREQRMPLWECYRECIDTMREEFGAGPLGEYFEGLEVSETD